MRRREKNSPPFSEIMMAREVSRRDVLRFSAKGTMVLAGAGMLGACDQVKSLTKDFLPQKKEKKEPVAESSLTFREIKKTNFKKHVCAQGYRADAILRWGDPLWRDDGQFDPAKLTPEYQARRFGYNNDFTAYFPLPWGSQNSEHGLLCVNHEYTNLRLMFPGVIPEQEVETVTEIQARTEQESLGISVVEVAKFEGKWRTVRSGMLNRRVTATTPIRISGPAKGHPRMQTTADPLGVTVLGTFNNCAGGVTPWGTYLSCEENIDTVFKKPKKDNPEYENHKAMLIGEEFYYGWYRFEPRFDTDAEPREPNRFGWVVEIDPYHPEYAPVKHTALGRFKHESATCTMTPEGRLCVYMGDDDEFEYVYRFVSKRVCIPERPDVNRDLLEDGTLHVAKFHKDGTMKWIPLVYGENGLDEKNGFSSQADVLIETRRAGDVVGATPMDRPEDIEVNPRTGEIYVSLAKNKLREKTNAANPRKNNKLGHMLRLTPPDREGKPDHGAESYLWEIFLKAGDPGKKEDDAYYKGKMSENGWLTNPDNLAFDPEGRLWITTDGQPENIDKANSIYVTETHGAYDGVTKLFFNGPKGCEITGPSFTPDGKTMFVAIQHPSEIPYDSTFADPATRWPDFRDDMPPRPSVIAITKEDGGIIGS